MQNRRPDLNGLLILNKPLGWTSADCCRYIRKGTGGAKVGHAGTLDPLATGVLVLCLGKATKLIDSLMAREKRYLAEIDLAHTSPTFDLEVTPVPVAGAVAPSAARIGDACRSFVGSIQQVPPVHSAIWVDGRRSYHLARQGIDVVLPPRPVEVHSIDVIDFVWPRLTIDVRCGKGTYIRSLARDIGQALGVGGMLTALCRTTVGRYTLAEARDPTTITQGLEPHDLIAPPEAAAAPRPASTTPLESP